MVVLYRTHFSVLMTLGIRNQLTILVILYSSLFQQVHLLAELTAFFYFCRAKKEFQGQKDSPELS